MFILCTSGLIVNSKNEFLMLLRSANDHFLPGYWELPGGQIEMGEEPMSALKREVKEESGLDVQISYPLKAVSYYHDNINPTEAYGIFYYCKIEDENQRISVSHEHSDYKWVNFNNIPEIPITVFLKNIIEELKHHPLLNISKK